jgi:hypothetical protein
LQHRSADLDLESRVGKYTVVNANTPLGQRGGFFCNVCNCLMKDSNSYLDHINGRNHQQNLGMAMRVERSTVSQVKDRLDMHKRKQEEQQKEQSVEDRLQAHDEEERARKMAKKDKKKKKKKDGNEEGMSLVFVEFLNLQTIFISCILLCWKMVSGDEDKTDQPTDSTADTVTTSASAAVEAEPAPEQDEAEAAMMAAMGFGGFSSKKK